MIPGASSVFAFERHVELRRVGVLQYAEAVSSTGTGVEALAKSIDDDMYSLEHVDPRFLTVANRLIEHCLDPDFRGTSATAVLPEPLAGAVVDVARGEIAARGLEDRFVVHARGDDEVEIVSIEITPEAEELAERIRTQLDGGEQAILGFVQDFLAGSSGSVRFPVRVVADMLEGDALLPDGRLAASWRYADPGIDRVCLAMLRKTIGENGLGDRVSANMYDGYDVRLERPDVARQGHLVVDLDAGLCLGAKVVHPLEDFFIGFWWTLLEDGEPEEHFPFAWLLSKLCDDRDDRLTLVAGYVERGHLDHKVHEDLRDWIGNRDLGQGFVVSYEGDSDIWVRRRE